MKSIVILSGKGGVGKSSITASLAIAMSKDRKIICADCDVDASNLSLLFGLDTDSYIEWRQISTNYAAVIDKKRCIGCERCIDSCYFNTLKLIDDKPGLKKFGCEGCGVCEIVCPVKAIRLSPIDNAFIGYAKTDKGFFIASAQLLAGSTGSGKVVAEVKRKAREIGQDADLMMIDAAAGIGCPVIASVTGSDYAVLVTEPTPSGYEDMLRALEIVDHFRIKKGIIINKYDLNEEYSKKIESFAEKNNIRIISKIPFNRAFVEAMTRMVPIIGYGQKYDDLFRDVKHIIVEEMAR